MRGLHNVLLITVILLSLVLGASTLTRGHDWGDDFASYIMQAKSISNGSFQSFIEHNTFTVTESFGYIGPIAYPWGYPLIIVPAYLVHGVHPLTLKLPGLILFAGFLICLYKLIKRRFTTLESLIIVSLFAFNPMLIRFLDQILSDIPFLFISTLTLLFMLSDKRFAATGALWIGLSVGFAFFIRRQGILLLVGYFGALTWDVWQNRADKKKIRNSIQHVLVVSSAFALICFITAVIFPSEGDSYFVQYGASQTKTILEFVWQYTAVFGMFFGDHWAWQALYWFTILFFLIGIWTKKNEEKLFVSFFVIWMLFLITWPFWQGVRFIFPLLPIYIYFAYLGMKTFIERILQGRRQAGYVVLNIFWITISALFLFTSGRNAYINLRDNRDIGGPFDVYSDEMFRFIRENTSTNSVVVFFKPRAMRLFTDRDSIRLDTCDRLTAGDYVSIHKKWDNSQIPPDKIDECGIPLKSVFENRRFIVYQIEK